VKSTDLPFLFDSKQKREKFLRGGNLMEENRRVKMTKRMIKDALLDLLEREPLSKISVTDLCKLADVNRATFYAYYSDPQALLREIENDAMESFPVPENAKSYYTAEDLMRSHAEFFRAIRENAKVFRVLMVRTDGDDFTQRVIAFLMEKYYRHSEGDKSLLIRYEYVFATYGCIGLLKEWVRTDFPISAHKFAEIVVQMCIKATDIQSIEME